MPNRRKLNLGLAATGVLLLAAAGYLGLDRRRDGAEVVQLEAVAHQQALVGTLVTWADSLAAGTNRDQVVTARAALGQAIGQFDQGLGALLAGGQATLADGHVRRVPRVSGASARHALELASHVWLETGAPLGDLAAGQYSAYSAAGRLALAGLTDNHAELSQHLLAAADGIRLSARQRAQTAGYVTLAGGALGLAWLILLAVRLWPPRRPRAARAGGDGTPAAAPAAAQVARDAKPAPRRAAPYAPDIDFANVGAAVDQLSVDMSNIAGNSEKMRQAIESVGLALQGMRDSLQELARDTTEGRRLVRNADNAATFTAEAAGQLADSAREMSLIVERVTQLALRTRQVAAQIDGEAARTGRAGEAFTAAISQEVMGLARQTHRATAEIDATVSEVLATSRRYEEAIGQIVNNVAAIHQVSQGLGQLALDPPRRGQREATAEVAPAPAASATVAPRPAEAPAPAVPFDAEPVAPEPTPREVAETTSAAIAEAAGPAAADAQSLATAAPTAAAAAAPAPPPAPADPDDGGAGNVFMLGKPRRKPTVSEVLGAEPEPSASTAAEPAAAAPAAPPPPPAQPLPDGGSSGNVFLLNKPRAARPAAPPAPAATPAAEPPLATSPPAEATEAPKKNLIMLNSPKKPK